eukprot:Hpha_TRINITY_DN16110_c0_g1::TRINITY_DN16110_c0_g1_i1::g.5008::m.5008
MSSFQQPQTVMPVFMCVPTPQVTPLTLTVPVARTIQLPLTLQQQYFSNIPVAEVLNSPVETTAEFAVIPSPATERSVHVLMNRKDSCDSTATTVSPQVSPKTEGSASTAPESDPPRPCGHNAWTKESKKKGKLSLRCMECSKVWKIRPERHSKCDAFYAGSCENGASCERPHIYARPRLERFKRGLRPYALDGHEDAVESDPEMPPLEIDE